MSNIAFYNRQVFISEHSEAHLSPGKKALLHLENEKVVLLFSLDDQGIITMLEGENPEILGVSKDFLLGSSIFGITEKAPLLVQIKKFLRKHESSSTIEYGERVFQVYCISVKKLDGKISGTVGVVIDITDQKQTEEMIRNKSNQISLLYEAGKRLSKTLNINELYETVDDLLVKVAQFDTLYVIRYKRDTKMIQYNYIRDRIVGGVIDTSKIPLLPLAPPGFGILSEIIRSGKSAILNDYQERLKKVKTSYTVGTYERTNIKSGNAYKVRSALIVPIEVDKKVIGAIQIFSSKAKAYNDDQLNFIEALMQPVGLAINNAVLYQNAQSEIKERKAAETKIRRSLEEKNLLLKEVHHRVKNNLQIVKSLLSVQSKYIKDEVLLRSFNESQDRIQSIALIHELLYSDENLTKVNFSNYITRLTSYLSSSLGMDKNQINFEIDTQDVFMSIDNAIPCGLVINELVSNSIKHAFPAGRKNGIITIKFAFYNSKINKYELTISDNGVGLRPDFSFNGSSSLGMKIINNLSKQLDGTIEFKNDNGTHFKITFPPANYKQRLW